MTMIGQAEFAKLPSRAAMKSSIFMMEQGD